MDTYVPKSASGHSFGWLIEAVNHAVYALRFVKGLFCFLVLIVVSGVINVPFYACPPPHDPNATIIHSASGSFKLLSPVVDTDFVMSAMSRRNFKSSSNLLREHSGVQFVVVTVNHLGQESARSLASRTFQRWKLGNKGDDKGVLLLLAVQERRVWLEVGYGLEDVLSDVVTRRLLEKHGDLLKRGNHEWFINQVTNDVFNVLSAAGYNSFLAPGAKDKRASKNFLEQLSVASCKTQSECHDSILSLILLYLLRAWLWAGLAGWLLYAVSSQSSLLCARMNARTRSRDHLTLNGFTQNHDLSAAALVLGLYHAVRVLVTITCNLGLHKKLGRVRLKRSLANLFWDMLWIFWLKDLRRPVDKYDRTGSSSGGDSGGGSSFGGSDSYGGGGGDSGGGRAGY